MIKGEGGIAVQAGRRIYRYSRSIGRYGLALLLIALGTCSQWPGHALTTSSAPARHTFLPDRAPLFAKFHYGSLDHVNHIADQEYGFQTLSQFELLVISPPGELSESERSVATLLQSAGTALYGYVHLATTLYPLTSDQINAIIDECADAGYHGIFFDTAGYDYDVSRARFNRHTDHAHDRGLSVMANAWHPLDVLSDEPAKMNLSGAPSSLGPGDWILLESFYHRSDDHYAGEFGGIASTMDDYVPAVMAAHARGVRVMALAYHPTHRSMLDLGDRINSYNLALLLGLDGWSYGTSTPDNNLVPWTEAPGYSGGAGYLSDLRMEEGSQLRWVRPTSQGLIWFAATDEPPTRASGVITLFVTRNPSRTLSCTSMQYGYFRLEATSGSLCEPK